ncbi:MAG: acyl-CoA thioesterase-1 [Lentimonas sp.]|jgi:acyl-CoA thioesterase-1
MRPYKLRFLVFIKRLLHLALFLGCILPAHAVTEPASRILFFGDSLTAGYGIDPALAYPALIQQKIAAESIPATVTVGAVSGDTSAGGLRRVDWMLRQPVDIFVLALGANDGLRGVTPAHTSKNLQAIIDKVKAKYPAAKIVIAGMRMPPSLGKEYTETFAKIFPQLAATNQATLLPFLLAGVAGRLDLNLADRIHPNPAGHRILAENVWSMLKPLLD